METDTSYKEIFKLKKLLEDNNILFSFNSLYDGYQILYQKSDNTEASVIEHFASYGNKEDLLEIMGLLTDKELQEEEVLGYLTAEDVFNRIKRDLRK